MRCNVEFEYLYRDASNYKFRNSVVFTNPSAMSLAEAEERIASSLDGREFFISDQIRIPETFPFLDGPPTEDDHCLHHFAALSSTIESANDLHGRSIIEFVEEIEKAARDGWRFFDPYRRYCGSHSTS